MSTPQQPSLLQFFRPTSTSTSPAASAVRGSKDADDTSRGENAAPLNGDAISPKTKRRRKNEERGNTETAKETARRDTEGDGYKQTRDGDGETGDGDGETGDGDGETGDGDKETGDRKKRGKGRLSHNLFESDSESEDSAPAVGRRRRRGSVVDDGEGETPKNHAPRHGDGKSTLRHGDGKSKVGTSSRDSSKSGSPVTESEADLRGRSRKRMAPSVVKTRPSVAPTKTPRNSVTADAQASEGVEDLESEAFDALDDVQYAHSDETADSEEDAEVRGLDKYGARKLLDTTPPASENETGNGDREMETGDMETEGKETLSQLAANHLEVFEENTQLQKSSTELVATYASRYPRSLMWRTFVEMYYAYRDTYSFPSWINPEKMTDVEGRHADDAEFDYTRIFVPKSSHVDTRAHFTPAMAQYWEIKADHFDKLVLFKLGKFYELFYTDACIAQRLLDLKWMGHDEKAHVGFPEQALHSHAKRIVEAGFSVSVVEQMETPEELHERVKTQGAKAKAVNREICEVYSKGSLPHQMIDSVADAAKDGSFSAILVDVPGSKVFYKHMRDEVPSRLRLRTLLAQTTPKEVVVQSFNVPSDIIAILKALVDKPALTLMKADANSSHLTARDKIADKFKHFGRDSATQTQVLKACEECDSLSLALSHTFQYLDSLLLLEKTLAFSRFAPLDDEADKKMIIDAAAANALELVSGKWLMSPLMNVKAINRRLDAVEYLTKHSGLVYELRLFMKGLPDLERVTARTWTFAVKAERGAVYFADTIQKKIRNFLTLLNAYDSLNTLQDIWHNNSDAMKDDDANNNGDSGGDTDGDGGDTDGHGDGDTDEDGEDKHKISRLRQLMMRTEEGGLFPNLAPYISELRDSVVESAAKRAEYAPTAGSYEAYDEAIRRVAGLKADLDEYLKTEIWRDLEIDRREVTRSGGLKYVHTKYRYEIEADASLFRKLKSENDSVEMTSKREGLVRFHTETVRSLIASLTSAEAAAENCLFPFAHNLFQKFYDYRTHFEAAFQILAEVDVFTALAFNVLEWSIAASPMTRPKVFQPQGNDGGKREEKKGIADENGGNARKIGETAKEIGVNGGQSGAQVFVREGVHPLLCSSVKSFRSNTIHLNDSLNPNALMILTGPNMGGKSTLARQLALLVILAQMGSFVPAEEMALTPVDRIFTRIGARDAIMEGKSTFFVELEDTLSIVSSATSRSLAIIDELGRGTSVEEGSALALATAKYIAEKVGCLCVFSTHYQDHIEKELLKVHNASFGHMSVHINEEKHEIVFLYKLTQGICPKSHGLKVAKLAGIPPDVLK